MNDISYNRNEELPQICKASGIHDLMEGRGMRCENKKSFQKLFTVPCVPNQV